MVSASSCDGVGLTRKSGAEIRGGEERALPSRILQVEGVVMMRGVAKDMQRGRMITGRKRNGYGVVGRG